MRHAIRRGLCAALLCAAAAALGSGCAHAKVAEPSAGQRPRLPARYVSPFAYEWFVRAELLRARGKLGPAIEAYRTALADAEDDPYVLCRLATALDEAGARSEAQSVLAEAPVSGPESEVAWLARAEIASRHAELPAALDAYEHAESAAPWSANAPLALAKLLRKGGQPERAVAVLERFEARTLPGSAGAALARLELALARDDGEGLFRAAQASLRVTGSGQERLLRTARALLDAGKPALAARILAAVPEDPAHAELRLRVLIAAGELAAAEALLATADPDRVGGLPSMARAYLALGRPERALALAKQAVDEAPADAESWLAAAQAQLALGAYADAADSFSQVPRESRSYPAARVGLTQALRASGLGTLADEIAADLPAPRNQ